MWRSWLMILVFCCSVTAQAKTILLVGDSLSAAYGIETSAGWVALLQQRLQKEYSDYQLINASISGDTTSNGLARLPAELKQRQPIIVIIEYGGNDGLRGLSLQAMQTNLSKMIQLSQQAGAKVLVLGVRLPPNYGLQYTTAFYQIYQDVAAQYKTALVPMLLEGVGGNPEFTQDDGIHPNEKAQPCILDNVWKALVPLL